MKVSEMKEGITYILCPDPSCKLFWKPGRVPCEHECPKEAEMKKLIYCPYCKKTTVLDGDHQEICRVNCICGVVLFYRMSGKYQIIYEMPEGN